MITTKPITRTSKPIARRKKNNIFGAFKGKIVELVPDPFNTGYDEMKRRKEAEAKKRQPA